MKPQRHESQNITDLPENTKQLAIIFEDKTTKSLDNICSIQSTLDCEKDSGRNGEKVSNGLGDGNCFDNETKNWRRLRREGGR